MKWVGIDEAGYGPNLGPLVFASVTAQGDQPDLWADLAGSVDRAGGRPDRLWIDDSKAIYRGGKGRERLEEATVAALVATGASPPSTLSGLLAALGSGSFEDVELAPWLEPGHDPPFPSPEALDRLAITLPLRPLNASSWRIVAVRAEVVGPGRFNEALDRLESKAEAHFEAFARLLSPTWAEATEETRARGDKHGGRHFYLGPLASSFPDARIDRVLEALSRSVYTLRDGRRRLELELTPRADSGDGLVALASIVAKTVREAWMAAFNAFWTARIPGLRPSAGYPVDARRFRALIETEAAALGLAPGIWWRSR